jgi:undecaprenyl-phosphate 4-deoxy-4-formamido-L-arabinose transferase
MDHSTPTALAEQGCLDLSIVVPVYGSELILPALVEEIRGQLFDLYRLELILVNDNSPDGSWRVACELAAGNQWIRAFNLRKNVGQHMAIFAGLREARGQIIVTMDDDLQHAPSDIPLLIDALSNDMDVCYGAFRSRNHAAWKIIGSKFNDLVATWLLHKPRGLYLSPFRALTRGVRDEVIKFSGPAIYLDGLILSSTSRITSVPVGHHARNEGTSGYSLRKSISLWLKMATSFSIAPLRLVSMAGLAASGVGFALAILIVIQKLLYPHVAVGWSSLIVSILIMGGVQLVALGAIGEYAGRILLNLTTPCQYSIRESTDDHKA